MQTLNVYIFLTCYDLAIGAAHICFFFWNKKLKVICFVQCSTLFVLLEKRKVKMIYELYVQRRLANAQILNINMQQNMFGYDCAL